MLELKWNLWDAERWKGVSKWTLKGFLWFCRWLWLYYRNCNSTKTILNNESNLSPSGASTVSQDGVVRLVTSGIVLIHPLQLALHISDTVWLCHRDLLLKKGEACNPPSFQTQPGSSHSLLCSGGDCSPSRRLLYFHRFGALRFNSGYLDEVSVVSLPAHVLGVLPW